MFLSPQSAAVWYFTTALTLRRTRNFRRRASSYCGSAQTRQEESTHWLRANRAMCAYREASDRNIYRAGLVWCGGDKRTAEMRDVMRAIMRAAACQARQRVDSRVTAAFSQKGWHPEYIVRVETRYLAYYGLRCPLIAGVDRPARLAEDNGDTPIFLHHRGSAQPAWAVADRRFGIHTLYLVTPCTWTEKKNPRRETRCAVWSAYRLAWSPLRSSPLGLTETDTRTGIPLLLLMPPRSAAPLLLRLSRMSDRLSTRFDFDPAIIIRSLSRSVMTVLLHSDR